MPKDAKDGKAPITAADPKKNIPTDPENKDDMEWLDEGFEPLEEDGVGADAGELPGRLESILTARIMPNPWNPNTQNDKQFDQLVRRMREVGMIAPIQVVPIKDEPEADYMIIGGEHRWRAAKSLGWDKIPAIILTDQRFENQDLQKFVTMQLNMIAGKLDPEKFLKLYGEMSGKYEDTALQDLMGFTEKQRWTLLTKGVAAGLPAEARGEFKDKAKDASPEELGNIIDELLGKYGNDLRFNFMVFTLEGHDHIWVRMEPDTDKLIKNILDLCRSKGIDVNVALQEGFAAAVKAFGGDA